MRRGLQRHHRRRQPVREPRHPLVAADAPGNQEVPRRVRHRPGADRKSTRLNSSHTEIYTLSLHDALPISSSPTTTGSRTAPPARRCRRPRKSRSSSTSTSSARSRSEEHTSELQSHRDLHSFPTRRSSDLIIADDNRFENRATRSSLPTPQEIKKFLDEYVIGQERTKKKLAVYNHYKRIEIQK